MFNKIFFLLLLPCLLLAAAPQAHAARKAKTSSKAADYRDIPAFNWGIMASGFAEVFKLRNREIEAAEPNRFFPASVAFALGRMDREGHFLMLKCSSSGDCGSMRDSLEERVVYSTLLQVIRTPRASKDRLYNEHTWELTPLGERYIEKLRKRYPDFNKRLARLMYTAFPGQ